MKQKMGEDGEARFFSPYFLVWLLKLMGNVGRGGRQKWVEEGVWLREQQAWLSCEY